MLQINGKTFMNLQEAVQWLLDNNALPFQSSANYVANTEIGMGTIVNPSPAKVRIGSLIFFADSKVSTVTGLTENGFIVSDQYNDLVDDIVYVSNVAINASGHLIVTLSNGTDIDAGLIKQVAGFSINASQHLIVSFNDGTSTDLGAIFSGNINISGTLNATNVTGDSIIETMSGYSATLGADMSGVFQGAVKNGNKLTFVSCVEITPASTLPATNVEMVRFTIPASIGNKLFARTIGAFSYCLDARRLTAWASTPVDLVGWVEKSSGTSIKFYLNGCNNLTPGVKYFVRYEATFLLSNSLA